MLVQSEVIATVKNLKELRQEFDNSQVAFKKSEILNEKQEKGLAQIKHAFDINKVKQQDLMEQTIARIDTVETRLNNLYVECDNLKTYTEAKFPQVEKQIQNDQAKVHEMR